jgi:hypothetical protein
MSLAARIEGVGLVGPGLSGWEAARGILTGREPFVRRPTVLPVPEALPPTERRRAGTCVRLSLAAGLAASADAGREPRDLVAIFASSTGDGENLHAICEALASDDRLISPTRFHNSVHNAPVGYWSIATGAMLASDSIAAFDASFAAGLLEALGRLAQDPTQPVLLVAYDAPYPEPLYATRPTADPFAVGLVLVAVGSGGGTPITASLSDGTARKMPSAELERMRLGTPAGRSLPLLAQLALAAPGVAHIEYLDGATIAVEVGR